MEEKIKDILENLISEIDGDWAIFMKDSSPYISKYLPQIMDVINERQ